MERYVWAWLWKALNTGNPASASILLRGQEQWLSKEGFGVSGKRWMLLSDCQRPRGKLSDACMNSKRGEVTLRLLVSKGNDCKLPSEEKFNLVHWTSCLGTSYSLPSGLYLWLVLNSKPVVSSLAPLTLILLCEKADLFCKVSFLPLASIVPSSP